MLRRGPSELPSARPLPQLLIVDDLEQYLDSLARALAEQWDVTVARNKDEAHVALSDGRIDVALVDVRLSETDGSNRDGIELLSQMRLRHPHIPVVLMSAYADLAGPEDAAALGASAFVRKPVDLALMRRILWEHRPQPEHEPDE